MGDDETGPGGQIQGAPELAACPACGMPNPVDKRFCGDCGSSLSHPEDRARTLPERREVTVLFCDLAGSTMLANRLDPEELRKPLVAYQDVCKTIIERWLGYVARYVGDGILAYFGHQRAREDDPERATRAALEIVTAVSALTVNVGGRTQPLAVRVGIATGLVLVGDIIGEAASQQATALGATPNLAARLQGLAAANTVLIAAETRKLLGERFECEDLGMHELRGYSVAVPAWRVVAPKWAASRFLASQSSRVLPLVDREVYTRWLRSLWNEAAHARGRVGLLCGEPGIGKSRIVEALREGVGGTPYAPLRYQCSPHYINTALHPVIEHIERAAGIRHEDIPAEKRARLAAWVATGSDDAEAVPLLAALLSIPSDAAFSLAPMSAKRQKERMFEVLLGFVQRLALAWPLPIVFEDVHWIDPTTLEFLTELIDRVRDMPALLVVTYRPDFVPPTRWLTQPHVSHRNIVKLEDEHARGLVERAGGQGLSKEIITQILAKTGNVPLFLEEFTRAVLDSASGADPHRSRSSRRDGGLSVIPSTLKGALTARVDDLGPAKIIAQIASVIGREFSCELLEAVAQVSPERLRQGLQALEASGLVYREVGLDVERYAFKHALVRDAAYEMLELSRRIELHTEIATLLERRFPQTARDAPELVAHHREEAGDIERAVDAWLIAGRRASERSEYQEAIAHLRRGLELIPRLDDVEMQSARELALLLALGPALITTEGGGTPRVTTLYTRALELCEAMPESEAHFVAQWGWWRTSMNHRTGRQRADKLLELAGHLHEPQLLVQAHHCEWATLYMLGAHDECCRHIDAGLNVYELKQDRVYSALYGGHDAKVCGLGEGALARWMLGRADSAVEYAQSALDWAGELAHVGSRAHAMDYALVLQKFRRDVKAVHLRAEALHEYASEQKLLVHRAKSAIFRGWARAFLDDVAGGLREMLEGIASEKGTDTPTDFPLYYEMLAEVYGRAGREEEGLRAVNEAFAVAERQGIVFWNAELHRRRGELLVISGDSDGASHAFHEALACARAHAARSLELRAATSLGRLHKRQHRSEDANAVLRPVYEGFREGLHTPDLTEARVLLGELR